MTGDFPAYFRYSCVPKLQSRAYLKAKVKNGTGYPLLAGWANVFLNNSFICRTQLKYASPGQEFWTWLGLDVIFCRGRDTGYPYDNKIQVIKFGELYYFLWIKVNTSSYCLDSCLMDSPGPSICSFGHLLLRYDQRSPKSA